MVLLVVISLAFTALAAWRPRWWTLLVPFAIYLGLAWLEQQGILPGQTGLDSALLAGAVGAAFAAIGLLLGRSIRSRVAA